MFTRHITDFIASSVISRVSFGLYYKGRIPLLQDLFIPGKPGSTPPPKIIAFDMECPPLQHYAQKFLKINNIQWDSTCIFATKPDYCTCMQMDRSEWSVEGGIWLCNYIN